MARESKITREYRERAERAESEAMLRRHIDGLRRAGEQPYAVERTQIDGAMAEYELWAPLDPAGGILLTVWRAGDYLDTTVQLFDDARDSARALAGSNTHVEYRRAVEALSLARSRAYEAA